MPDDSQNLNMDPWSRVGNSAPNTVSEEGLERESKWNEAMSDAPAFVSEQFGDGQETSPTTSTQETTKFDEKLSQASRILKYVNEAPGGLDAAMEVLEHFDPSHYTHPWTELKKQLGIMEEDYDSLASERHDFAESENERNTLLQKHDFMVSENAPDLAGQISRQDLEYALTQVKNMISDVKSGNNPKYQNLNSKATAAGMGHFDYLTKDEEHKDIATLFNVLSNQDASETTPAPEESDTEESSTEAADENILPTEKATVLEDSEESENPENTTSTTETEPLPPQSNPYNLN